MSISKLLKSIAFLIVLITVLLVGGVYWLAASDRAIDYDVSTDGISIPTFDEQTIDFIPTYDKMQTLPFTAGAIIDIDNDGIEEVFFGGGIHQQDRFYRFENNSFVDITTSTGWKKQTPDKTFSATALDLDQDGDTDLLVTRQSGVWHYDNEAGAFTGVKLDLDIDPESVPLSVGVSDLNRDGLFDLFVAGYIARKHVQGETIFNMPYGGRSALFINKGNNQFENITEKAGLTYQHNTFLGMFIDVDQDGLEDLMVAYDTGTIKTWKNLGDLKFKDMPNPSTDSFAYPMGIGVTDLGNDGLPDFYFSNVGSTTPAGIVRGDLREDQVLNKKWFMFRNRGGFVFEDVGEEVKIADYEFSWGAIFEDFNLDGKDDLVVSENYVGFPLHNLEALRLDGRFMVQNNQGEFAAVGKEAGVQNRLYSITPLTADFNQDGYPDLIHVNLLGPQKVFLSKGGNANYLKVKLPNTTQSISALVTVTLADGELLRQSFVVGEGLCSDQSHILNFGLDQQTAKSVLVQYLGHPDQSETGNFANQILTF